MPKPLRPTSPSPTTTSPPSPPAFWLLSAARATLPTLTTALPACASKSRTSTAVDEKAVKKAGAAGVIRPSKTACQVVIGPKVQFVYDELKKML